MRLDVDLGVVLAFRSADTSDPEQEREHLRRLASLIQEWNVEDDDGNAIPVHDDCLFKVPPSFTMTLLTKWMEAVVEAPAPLGKRSDVGEYPPAPIPMVAVR